MTSQVMPMLALETADLLLDRLRDRSRMLAHLDSDHWAGPSVSGGDAGLALAFEQRARLGDGEAGLVAHQYLSHAIEDTDWAGWPLGLVSGLGGLVLTVHQLSRGGRYQNARKAVEAAYLGRVEAHLQTLPGQGGLPSHGYDTVSGLTGITRVLMDIEQPEAAPLLQRSLQLLIGWAQNGGFVTRPQQVPQWEARLDPATQGGYLNLGLSHGIAGPLMVFALAARRSRVLSLVPFEELQEAATGLVKLLQHHATLTPWGPDLPARVHTDLPQRDLTRAAWCYGNPGVAMAIHQAGEAFGKAGWQAWAVGLLESVAHRPAERWQLEDDMLCHGTAGLYLIFNLASRWPQAPRQFEEVAAELLRTLVSHLDPHKPFGFQQHARDAGWRDQPGVLEGAAGIALALMHGAHREEDSWLKLLLLA